MVNPELILVMQRLDEEESKIMADLNCRPENIVYDEKGNIKVCAPLEKLWPQKTKT